MVRCALMNVDVRLYCAAYGVGVCAENMVYRHIEMIGDGSKVIYRENVDLRPGI